MAPFALPAMADSWSRSCPALVTNVLLWRSATLLQLGRTDEARGDVQALLAVRPGATVNSIRQSFNQLRNPDQFLDSLRQAGVPE